jgi:hypothetical protein
MACCPGIRIPPRRRCPRLLDIVLQGLGPALGVVFVHECDDLVLVFKLAFIRLLMFTATREKLPIISRHATMIVPRTRRT